MRPGRVEGGDDALPSLVRAALAAEFDALGPVEELVARAAAVVGDQAGPDLLAEAATLAVDEVLVALDALVQRDLLRPVPRTDRFQFRHPLVRRVAYDSAGAGWRIAAHARTAAALRRQGAPAVEQAHHLERSARGGDLGAVDVLREAATAAMTSSPASAAHWLGAALRLIPNVVEEAGRRMEILGLRAHALGVSGQLRDSRDALHELLTLLPPELSELRARLTGACAATERLFSRHAEANALLLAELASLPDQQSPAAVALMVGLAGGKSLGTYHDEADWPGRAVAAARRNGLRFPLVAALTTAVLTDQLRGTIGPHTTAALDEAVELVDSAADGELAQLVEVVVGLATAELCHERPYDVLRHVDRGLDVARSTGQTYVVGQLHMVRGIAFEQTGDLTATGACFEDAADAAALMGMAEHTALLIAYQANLVGMQGDTALAVRLAEESVGMVGHRDDFFAATAVMSLAQAHLLAGRPATCVDVLQAGPEPATLDPMSRSGWYELLARAEAARDPATWAPVGGHRRRSRGRGVRGPRGWARARDRLGGDRRWIRGARTAGSALQRRRRARSDSRARWPRWTHSAVAPERDLRGRPARGARWA